MMEVRSLLIDEKESELTLLAIQDDSHWEPTFDALLSGDFWSQLPMARVVYRLDWQRFVQQSRIALATTPVSPDGPIGGECYERVLDITGGGHYRLIWDVGCGLQIAHRDHLDIQQIPSRDLLPGVSVDDLDPARISQVDPTQGVVIAGVFPLLSEQFIVIDGNHRIYRAQETGSPLSVVILDEQQMVESLISARCRLHYAIHWNLSRWITIEVTGNVPAIPPWRPLTAHHDTPPLL